MPDLCVHFFGDPCVGCDPSECCAEVEACVYECLASTTPQCTRQTYAELYIADAKPPSNADAVHAMAPAGAALLVIFFVITIASVQSLRRALAPGGNAAQRPRPAPKAPATTSRGAGVARTNGSEALLLRTGASASATTDGFDQVSPLRTGVDVTVAATDTHVSEAAAPCVTPPPALRRREERRGPRGDAPERGVHAQEPAPATTDGIGAVSPIPHAPDASTGADDSPGIAIASLAAHPSGIPPPTDRDLKKSVSEPPVPAACGFHVVIDDKRLVDTYGVKKTSVEHTCYCHHFAEDGRHCVVHGLPPSAARRCDGVMYADKKAAVMNFFGTAPIALDCKPKRGGHRPCNAKTCPYVRADLSCPYEWVDPAQGVANMSMVSARSDLATPASAQKGRR